MENENNMVRVYDSTGGFVGYAKASDLGVRSDGREHGYKQVWVSDNQDGSNGRFWRRFSLRSA